MPQPSVDSPGYATGRATKKSIVASAANAFSQKGFYGASLRSIAAEAGVDHSTLIHHFGNKTHLLLAVIAWHDQQQFRDEFPRRLTADALVESFVNAARSNQASPGLVQLLSILNAEAGVPGHPARDTLQRRHRRLVSLFTWVIRRQRARLQLPDNGLTPKERAALIVATWDGLQVFDALNPGVIDIPAHLGRTLRHAFGLTEAEDKGANPET